MQFLVDKIILIILSVFMLCMRDGSVGAVVVLLVTVCFSAANSYFDSKINTEISTCLCVGVLFMFPKLAWMMPVILYDVYTYRNIASGALFILAAAYNLRTEEPYIIIYVICITVLGGILNYRSHKSEAFVRMMKKIRDDGQERNLLLAEKNQHLIEKQDYEIYVATLRERNRIAREIHDNVGHIITRSILQMGALMTINKEEPLHGQLVSVKENLDTAMNSIRESVHDLHDESVDLKQAVTELAESLKPRFICKLDYDIPSGVERKYKYAIIGIVKEAVSNVIKHSRNNMVDITLREHPSMYQIIIHDYDSSHANRTAEINDNGGIGIQNMQDRVAGLRGHISFSTDDGFKIFATLPRNTKQ